MSSLPTSSSSPSVYYPPPYPSNDTEITAITATSTAIILQQDNSPIRKPRNHQYHHHHTHHHLHYHHKNCYLCKNRNIAPNVREIGPYLIHRTQPDLVIICPCLHKAHPTCLKELQTDYICNICNSIYQLRYIRFAQLLCLACHLLSLASTIGLVFGLSHLGRALDELGLGSEMGPKLDGDETWQDHEMLEIVEWLNIVHFATGVAGEALLGLVYMAGSVEEANLDQCNMSVDLLIRIRTCIGKDELKNDFWLPTIKRRRRFSIAEIKLLENEYSVSCNPNQEKVEEIAGKFKTNKKIITTWFQNRRAKNKKLHSLSPTIQEEEQEFNDNFTEESNDNTGLSNDFLEHCYDSDTLNVINGSTALTTPTFTLQQQEYQHILSTLDSPQYRSEHLHDYFSNTRHDLYYYTKDDPDAACSLFTSTTSATIPMDPPPEDFLPSNYGNGSILGSPCWI
ncbi:hypothetical protein BD408DRAFT_439721 [Parasitella parasitica]|nr:hypothetical protein BD408DRAFT_439721 [Parasitella parasitica]